MYTQCSENHRLSSESSFQGFLTCGWALERGRCPWPPSKYILNSFGVHFYARGVCDFQQFLQKQWEWSFENDQEPLIELQCSPLEMWMKENSPCWPDRVVLRTQLKSVKAHRKSFYRRICYNSPCCNFLSVCMSISDYMVSSRRDSAASTYFLKAMA